MDAGAVEPSPPSMAFFSFFSFLFWVPCPSRKVGTDQSLRQPFMCGERQTDFCCLGFPARRASCLAAERLHTVLRTPGYPKEDKYAKCKYLVSSSGGTASLPCLRKTFSCCTAPSYAAQEHKDGRCIAFDISWGWDRSSLHD